MKNLLEKIQLNSKKTEDKTSTLEQCIIIERHLRDFESKNKISSNSFRGWILNLSKWCTSEAYVNR